MEKPWVLVSKLGPGGICLRFAHLVEQHFTVVTEEHFHRDRCGQKIRAVFVWATKPTVNRALLEALPTLAVVVSGGVGVDHLDVETINKFGVKVCNTPYVVDGATADLGMALMLASARNLLYGHNFCLSREMEWMPEDSMGTDVTGATLGIIGMGRIGYQVAKRAKGFDMKILYHNRNRRKEEEEAAVGARYCKTLDELLCESDFVMVVVNLSPQTHKLIGARELAMMKPTATLINISRGLVVDQDALVDVLQRGAIRAAALDVTYPEPLPRDHPLLALPNAIVVPHIGTYTLETMQMMVERMVINALAVLRGDEPPNEVKM
ncbi:hypothetical protein GN956_G22081 [Arapaima gigas]